MGWAEERKRGVQEVVSEAGQPGSNLEVDFPFFTRSGCGAARRQFHRAVVVTLQSRLYACADISDPGSRRTPCAVDTGCWVVGLLGWVG